MLACLSSACHLPDACLTAGQAGQTWRYTDGYLRIAPAALINLIREY